MLDVQPPPILGLLSDAVRWRMVAELARSDRRTRELVEIVGRPQNLVSYHLATLRRAGVVTARRSSADARDVYYRVDVPRCREMLAEAGLALHPFMSTGTPIADALGRRGSRRPRVLFLCTGNSARSQIAEALVEHHSRGAVEACSAGSHPKPLHEQAVRVLAARGIDISGRASKPLTLFARSRFDRVITLCDKVREVCPEFPGPPVASHWSVRDPASAGEPDAVTAAFEQAADEIQERVACLLAEFTVRGSEPHTK